MFGGAGFQQHLEKRIAYILREDLGKNFGGAGLKGVFQHGAGGGVAYVPLANSFEGALAAESHRIDRQKLLHAGDDGGGIDEVVEANKHVFVITGQEFVLEELRDGAEFREAGGILDREIRDEVFPQAGEGLRSLAADRDKFCFRSKVRGDDFFQQVSVERTAEAFVAGNQDHQRFAALSFQKVRMHVFLHAALEADEDFVQKVGIGATGSGGVLRLLHLGSRNHLHGPGDLSRIFDGFDAAADVAGAGHKKEKGFRVQGSETRSGWIA